MALALAGILLAGALLVQPGWEKNFGAQKVERTATGGLNFDGTLQYVEVPDSDSYTLNTTDELTVEAWIRPAKLPLAQIVVAKGKRDAYEWELRFLKDRLNFFAANPRGVPNFALVTSPPLRPGVARHVAASIRQGIFSRMFIDGEMVAESTTFVGGTINGPAPLTIGARDGLGPFWGRMDEVRIWNVARTEAEIAAVMRRPLPSSTAGLVGYWRFNESGGTTAMDSSRLENHGKLVNRPERLTEDLATPTAP